MKLLSLPLILVCLPFFNFSQINKNKFNYLGNNYDIVTYRDVSNDIVLTVSNLKAKKIDQITISKNESEHSFINSLSPLFKSISDENKLELTDGVPLTTDKLDYNSVLNAIKKMSSSDIKKYLVTKNVLANKNAQLVSYFTNIEANNIIVKDGVLMIKNDPEPASFDKEKIENSLAELIKEQKDSSLRVIILSQSDYNEIVADDVEFTEEQKNQLRMLYKKSFGIDAFQFIGNYKAKSTNDTTVYEASINQNSELKFFELRLCKNGSYNCLNSIKLDLEVNRDLFYTEVRSMLKKQNDIIYNEYLLESLYQKCVNYNQDQLIKFNTKPYKRSQDSLLQAIENMETRYSGVLKLNKVIKIKFEDKNITNFVFSPKFSNVRFFNNRVKKIVLVGDIVNKNTGEKLEHISINFEYSIPMKNLNGAKGQSVEIKTAEMFEDKVGKINYSDVFKFYPYENSHNYSVKNKEYRLNAGDSVKIEERKLADYVTPILFSDFLGLNSNNSNGLVQAEAVAIIPLWIKNVRRVSWIPSLRADFNVSLYNGFDDDSRFINKEGFAPFDSNQFDINPFNFVKYANINTGISLNVFSLEMKGMSSVFNIGGGIRYFRSGFKYTQIDTSNNETDIITRDQVNSLSPELLFNFQIRPQANFGADINLSVNYIHPAGSKNNAIFDMENIIQDSRYFARFSLDLFSKVNPDVSQGGIYARLGGFFHLGNDSQDFYPQIMVGYATNLSSFVNRFSKD